ncbi:MAG: AAA family ATPase [Clostridia bacterium]|nr:AAA family ATPase [Clostridia bacterium]
MNLLLTGPRGIGKTTALQSAAARLARPLCGYVTRFIQAPESSPQPKALLMLDGSCLMKEPPAFSASLARGHLVGYFGGGSPNPVPDFFDRAGTEILSGSLRNAPEDAMIILDEIGYLEEGSPAFRRALMDALSDPRPLLGVLREGVAWHREITERSDVQVICVTEKNRDDLPRLLSDALLRHP